MSSPGTRSFSTGGGTGLTLVASGTEHVGTASGTWITPPSWRMFIKLNANLNCEYDYTTYPGVSGNYWRGNGWTDLWAWWPSNSAFAWWGRVHVPADRNQHLRRGLVPHWRLHRHNFWLQRDTGGRVDRRGHRRHPDLDNWIINVCAVVAALTVILALWKWVILPLYEVGVGAKSTKWASGWRWSPRTWLSSSPRSTGN